LTVAAVGPDWTFGGTWPYEPRWLTTSDGIRLHYVDEGPRPGRPIVMVHGNPTWSYAFRHFIRAFRDAGFRAIAYDQMGYGRSDKPEDPSEYSLERHTRQFGDLVQQLVPTSFTLLIRDWGGPIALGWAIDHPERVSRIVVLNTATGELSPDLSPRPSTLKAQPPFQFFRAVAVPGLGELMIQRAHLAVRGILFLIGLKHRSRLGPNEKAAYLAPHPTRASRAGILAAMRRFKPYHPPAETDRRTEAGLGRFSGKPVLICWSMGDPALGPRALARWRRLFPAAEVHEVHDSRYYPEEDAYERIIPHILDFLTRA
jgi:haloalkane dehalogenase